MHPTLRNPKWTQQVFESARQPKAWMHVARRLRSSADAIFERENPVAARHWDEIRRLMGLAAEGNSPPEDYDETKFPWPNFDAAFMLMAYAIENLLKGLAIAKGLVRFSGQELPKTLKDHDLHRLHQLVGPRATIASHALEDLTYMLEWRARYPLPTSVDKFWPMRGDGTMKGGSCTWPDFNKNILAYYDALEAELQEVG
jgi:hypothetical protein